MKWNQQTNAFLFLLMASELTISLEASARPKRDINGCLNEQYQTHFAQSCGRQAEQDLLQNKPYYHVLVCNGDEMLCCTRDAKTGATLTCRKPGNASRAMPNPLNTQKFESITSRGIEGEDAGEETAPPAWVTERGSASPDEIKERGMKRPNPQPTPPIPPKGPIDPKLPPIGPGGTGPTVPK